MDTSRLPEPLRRKLETRLAQLPAAYRRTLEAQLARLPAAQLEAVLAKSSPTLDRLMDRLGVPPGTGSRVGAGAPVAPPSLPAVGAGVRSPIRVPAAKGHYNTTVQRGDAPMPRGVVMLAALLGFLALAWHLGWLSG
jgi:hypothetical protein